MSWARLLQSALPLAFLTLATAAPLETSLVPRHSVCAGNTPSNRSAWCGYSTSTDYYTTWPNTGVTVEYNFEISEITLAPDGVPRKVLAINGQFPGPTIEANWGDTVVVNVKNSLPVNGTTIHFHGVRQWYTNPNDGVPSVTECPITPNTTTKYVWQATEYGTSWYHSHYTLEAWDGIAGGIRINGPATANYDDDIGVVFLSDWDHQSFEYLALVTETQGPPTLDNGLINGKNVWNSSSTSTPVGSRWQTTVNPGKTYRMRLVNGAIDTHFNFMIDNHPLTVIAMDFVPIHPYTTDTLSIGIGQRYDILFTANQSVIAKDFWLRAIPDTFCSKNNMTNNIRGIIHYNGSTSTPTTTQYPYNTTLQCFGEPASKLVPFLPLNANTTDSISEDLHVTGAFDGPNNYFRWSIGPTYMTIPWGDPTAQMVINGVTNFANHSNIYELPGPSDWALVVIETTLGAAHPIHLHGHDFFQLAQGYGTYAGAAPKLNTINPPRRDVAMLPAKGYLVIAFPPDNPGVWLCHCHIGWHTSEGFDLQFIERRAEIPGLYNVTALEDSCKVWNAFQNHTDLVQPDSGV